MENPELDPQAEDKQHEATSQAILDAKHSLEFNRTHECFYCDVEYLPKDALEDGVPVEWATTYHSKACYEVDLAGMEADKSEE